MDANIKSEEVSFEELKSELEKPNSFNILKRIKSAGVKSFTQDQFAYICSVIQRLVNDYDKRQFGEIRDVLQFLEWMQSIVLKKGFGIRCMVLMITLKFIHRFLTQDSNDSKNSSAQQNDIKSMILLALKNMADCDISATESTQLEYSELLQKVLELLFDIVVIKPPFIEIKIILDLWKSYSNIFMTYIKQRRLLGTESIEDIKIILEKPIKYLLTEVRRSLDLIYRVPVLQQPIAQVEKYLRIINFYMRILQILTAAVKHKAFVAVNEFFESHKKSKLLPKSLAGTEIANLIEKNIQKDFDLLLKYVYQHPEIFKLLIAYLNESSMEDNCFIIEAYLSIVLSNEDGSFIASKTTEFIKIFELCFNDPNSQENADFNDVMVTHFSALTMLDESPNLLTYFRETVLGENFWLAAASSDILILIQKFQHKHLTQYNDALMNEFNFWRNCYSKFALFSNDIKQVHILKLLNNCLELCASEIVPKAHMFSEDIRFLLANNLSNIETESKNCNSELYRLLSELAIGNGTIESYYKTIVYMKLLYNSMELDDKTMKILTEMTERLLNMGTQQSKAFSLFVNASLKLITKYSEKIGSYDNGKFIAHMQTLKQVATFPGSIQMLHFYTKSTSQQLRQRGNAALKQSLLDTCADVNFESLIEIIDLITDGKYIHNCVGCYIAEEPQIKRKCFEYKD